MRAPCEPLPLTPPQASDPASDLTLQPLRPEHPTVAALRARAEGVLDRGLAPAAALAASFGEYADRLMQVPRTV